MFGHNFEKHQKSWREKLSSNLKNSEMIKN